LSAAAPWQVSTDVPPPSAAAAQPEAELEAEPAAAAAVAPAADPDPPPYHAAVAAAGGIEALVTLAKGHPSQREADGRVQLAAAHAICSVAGSVRARPGF
jgi:hypothetical protein